MPQYRKLIERLSELCPTIESSQLILKFASIPTGDIAFNTAAEINWLNILDRVEVRGKLEVLIQTVIDKYEDDKLWEYAEDETSTTPLKDASKVFKEELDDEFTHKKQEIAQITGLNVLPRANFEKAMGGRDDSVYIEWLIEAIQASNIVCKVELSNGGSGTGFLLYGGYVLTNYHVICKHFPYLENCDFACRNTLDCPLRGQILMGYQTSEAAGPTTTYQLDPEHTYIINKELDYALIKIKDNPENPIANWGVANIESFKIPQKDDRVNIVQHPKGDRKKMAMPDPVISVWAENNWIFYLGDTDSGSSGSPVFNQEWNVVALHHAGMDESQGGMKINARGDIHEANRGVLISAIQKDLKLQGIDI